MGRRKQSRREKFRGLARERKTASDRRSWRPAARHDVLAAEGWEKGKTSAGVRTKSGARVKSPHNCHLERSEAPAHRVESPALVWARTGLPGLFHQGPDAGRKWYLC